MNTNEFEERRKRWNEQEASKVKGKISLRAFLVLARGYLYGDVDKPLEALTDKELRKIYGLGINTLAEIRCVIPAPAQKGAG